MKKITLALKHMVSCLIMLLSAISFAQSTASYDITFSSTWENETVDPVNGNSTAAIPGNAHWSNLVGATHNSNYTLVEMGTLASTGVKNVAELGHNDALMAEVMNEINNTSNANQWLQEPFSPFAAISSATLSNVVVSSDYPLLSLVSMIAPSPDWMIAVNGVNLRDGNTWKNEIIIDLFPYDAGTDSGATYEAANQVTMPFVPIDVLINQGPFNSKPIGTLTITLNETLSVDTQNINSVGLYPNPSHGKFKVLTSEANTLKSILVYDVLGKQVSKVEYKDANYQTQVDFTQLNKGVYLVRLVLKDGSQSTKKVLIN
ncbi:spondin domain-containing protein [Psychroserpens sp. SPM9]|uniref:T9SS type A sorting domain-containing protein n=1 Tax=Psychroserpens sp. SPM9 TaxID=2975598 RepID=UPI0021A4223C|nr:spondin domain-containing protein [Psychroserpens sp. SPM9]MDG5492992.1 spondin domain-containing protein [Psychroserpens sp. SPM9]